MKTELYSQLQTLHTDKLQFTLLTLFLVGPARSVGCCTIGAVAFTLLKHMRLRGDNKINVSNISRSWL